MGGILGFIKTPGNFNPLNTATSKYCYADNYGFYNDCADMIAENIFSTITSCIDSIWDKESVYATKDHTRQEINDFLESLPDDSFTKIQKFFDTVPVLKHEFELKCQNKNGKGKKASVCGHKETKTLEGLASFFV